VLDVEAVELDAIGPGVRPRGLQEVFDLVVVDVQGQHLVRRLRYQLFAQVRPYEPPGTDHAYRHRLYRLPVQIYPRRRHSYSLSLSLSLTLRFFLLNVSVLASCVRRGCNAGA
jgi:hypothetical protein